MTDDTIQLSDSQTLVVTRSKPEVLELTSTWEATDEPPPTHWHPRQEEQFEVSSGVLTVELGDDPPQKMSAGSTFAVPVRTPHRMWNTGPDVATATWTITPALRTEEIFRYMERGVGGLRGVTLQTSFRNAFRLGRPRP
jgi:mannose-6-phosphate isomerase-like protein (cupin superfamily)